MKNKILCLNRGLMLGWDNNNGFLFCPEEESQAVKLRRTVERHGVWVGRDEAEVDESYKQVVVQILLTRGGKVAVHKIPETGGEARLHGRGSLFLGGHVDFPDGRSCLRAAERELLEEAGVSAPLRLIGCVNDESTAVGRVHFGLVYAADIPEGHGVADASDSGVQGLRFVNWSELPALAPAMTEWSRYAALLLSQESL